MTAAGSSYKRFRDLAPLSAPSAPAVGGRLPTSDGRPVRGLDRDRRGDDRDRRVNQVPGQDLSSKARLITPNHHIDQLGWLKLTVPDRRRRTARLVTACCATTSSIQTPAAGATRRGRLSPYFDLPTSSTTMQAPCSGATESGTLGEECLADHLQEARALLDACPDEIADGITDLPAHFESLFWFPLPRNVF